MTTEAIDKTPSGSDLTIDKCVRVSIAGGGTLKFDGPHCTGRTITLPAGYFEFQITKIYNTGTTATGITVYY